MLRFFAKFQRSRNFILLAFSALLLIGLIAFYIPNTPLDPTGRFSTSTADDGTVVAKVGSKEITIKQYRGLLEQYATRFGRGNSLPLSTLKTLGMDKQVLDQLIASTLIIDQAGELSLAGTDQEVAEAIKGQFTDETGKFIGAEEYKRRLRLQGVDINEFEDSRRDEITFQKFRNYLVSAEQVSDRDVEERFKKDNTQVEVVYTTVDLDKIREKYKPSDEDLKAYYTAHQAEFKAGEPTRKVDYLFISTDDAAKIVPVTEEQLRKEYEARKQFEYRASMIKLNVLSPQDEQTVQAKINDLAARLKGSPTAKGEDFAVVAKGNSQDASASKGGDIGWIKKDTNRADKWQQRIYTTGLKVGDIDGPFKDGQSWYLMKVTEQREVPFAQMRDTIKATVSNNEAYKEASRLADLAYEKATEYKDLRKAAEEIAKHLKVSPESLLKTTPYFKKDDPLPDLGKGAGRASNPAFEEAVSTLKKGEIGDKVSIPGGQAIPQLVDVIEGGQQLTFDQARNQVEDKLRREKEPGLAQNRAQQIASQANTVDEFKKLAQAEGLEIKTDTNFNSFTSTGPGSGNIQATNQARNAIIKMKEGEVWKTPIKVGTAYLVFAAVKRTEADLSKLSGERESLRQSLISERQVTAFDTFIKATRKLYESKGKIKVYQDRIDKFFSSADAQQ